MSEKIVTDKVLGEVVLRKSAAARRVSIRVTAEKGVIVTVPRWVPYGIGIAFLTAKREWARKTLERVRIKSGSYGPDETGRLFSDKETTETQKNLIIENLRRQAKAYLPARLAELADKYGFQYNKVFIKHNSSNWGSCSARKNINLNLNLMRLPQELSDYVILHELCHLRHPNHGEDFHQLLDSLCLEHTKKGRTVHEKEIRRYRLI